MSGPGESVEVAGAHLRVRGRLALGRFPRVADLVNHDRGVIVLHDATLLDARGQPTGLELPELVMAQDEVTFIGEEDGPGGADGDAPRCVIFTPGYTISGGIHRHRDPSLANFLSATDQRFFEVTDAVIRPAGDPAAALRQGCVLVNRTQVSAIAELPPGAADPAEAQPGA